VPFACLLHSGSCCVSACVCFGGFHVARWLVIARLQVAVGRMQMSLTEMLNLQVPQLVLTIQSPALTVRQEDVSQRRYVVKDCGVDDDGQTNDFGTSLRVFRLVLDGGNFCKSSHALSSRAGVVTLDVTALDALQNLARSQDM
jgi:hypothetical protein